MSKDSVENGLVFPHFKGRGWGRAGRWISEHAHASYFWTGTPAPGLIPHIGHRRESSGSGQHLRQSKQH